MLENLDKEQRKVHEVLEELKGAVDIVEGTLRENSELIKRNAEGLDRRVDDLISRVDKLNA